VKPIFVDDEVRAALEQRAEPPESSLNGVLRELLGLADEMGKLHGLVKEGLLHVGQEVIWNRAALRKRHTAVITANGGLRLENGQVYLSPSKACAALAEGRGRGFSGWAFWRTGYGQTLGDLRRHMQDRYPQEKKRGPGVLLAYLEQGVLKAGDRLVWDRRDATHTAEITEEGRIRLENGREFNTPSAACAAITGIAGYNGWDYWKTEDRRLLKELRRELKGEDND
jgi:hypothetical protein